MQSGSGAAGGTTPRCLRGPSARNSRSRRSPPLGRKTYPDHPPSRPKQQSGRSELSLPQVPQCDSDGEPVVPGVRARPNSTVRDRTRAGGAPQSRGLLIHEAGGGERQRAGALDAARCHVSGLLRLGLVAHAAEVREVRQLFHWSCVLGQLRNDAVGRLVPEPHNVVALRPDDDVQREGAAQPGARGRRRRGAPCACLACA
jgi:hypothetical protein